MPLPFRCTFCCKDVATNPCPDCLHPAFQKGRKHECEWSRHTLTQVICKECDRVISLEDYMAGKHQQPNERTGTTMGNRGNIVVRQKHGTNTDDVWFYTHWSGSDLPEILQRALRRKERWEDETDLARIIFCEMIAGSGDFKGETGYGISCAIGYNQHDILVVDTEQKTVSIITELPADLKGVTGAWTYEEYVTLTLKTLPTT